MDGGAAAAAARPSDTEERQLDATTVRGAGPVEPPTAQPLPPGSRVSAQDATTVGVAIGIPEPWGSQLDRSRAATGDPLAPFVPAHVTLLGPTDVEPDAL